MRNIKLRVWDYKTNTYIIGGISNSNNLTELVR